MINNKHKKIILLFIIFHLYKNFSLPKFLGIKFLENNLNSTIDKNRKKDICFNDNITDINSLIIKLNFWANYTKQTNIIFADYYISKSCCDKNAFILFEYYLENNIDHPYYIINNESEFYISLVKKNKTDNLILYNDKYIFEFYNELYIYLRDAKIIINSYTECILQSIASYVHYIKFLKINHGIKHFKVENAKIEFLKTLGNKKNVICSSPFEYELLVNVLKYKKENIYNASLVRYERFQYIHHNYTEKKCILISFTYRRYNNSFFQKSVYKRNLENLVNDRELIRYLSNKNINLVYIPHHEEIDLGKNYSQNFFKYAELKRQIHLEHYIEHCSLLITDYSSISFDFMFQNKPVLFYAIDNNEINYFSKIKNIIEPNDTLYFGNYFSDKNSLIIKIKYFINNNFIISDKLKKNMNPYLLQKRI